MCGKTLEQVGQASRSERMLNFTNAHLLGMGRLMKMDYSKTLEEVEFGWACGPLDLDHLPNDAVVSRRFGLRQPGKIRLL